MLEAVPDNDLFVQLVAFGIVSEVLRAKFAEGLISYCERGVDSAVLWIESFRHTLSSSEEAELRRRVRFAVITDGAGLVREATQWGDPNDDGPENVVAPLRELAGHLPSEFPNDDEVEEAVEKLTRAIDSWVSDQDWEDPDEGTRAPAPGSSEATPSAAAERSIFDDLLEGRPDK